MTEGVDMQTAVQIAEELVTIRRRARRPKWGGRHGSVVKGSVKWSQRKGGYEVVYSFLLGYETTLHASDVWDRWSTAMNQYREHDRRVWEKQKVERFRLGITFPV